jgi:V8-like Glu-specific endopeptidase
MVETLGIESIDELMDRLPLACLEEKMYRADFSFEDISKNYWMNSASADIIVLENQMDDSPVIVPPPTQAEAPYVSELMESEGISAREALIILRGREEVDSTIEMRNATYNQNNMSSRSNITPFSSRNNHTEVTTPDANPFKMVVNLETDSRFNPNGGEPLGTGFLVKNGMVVTAGHVLYCHDRGGSVNFVDASPGREWNWRPYGTHRIYPNNLFVSWIWYAYTDISHDWGFFHTGNVFNGVGHHWWLDARTDAQLISLPTTITGYPTIGITNPQMYTNNGTIVNNASFSITPNIFWSTNFSMNGYSGSPVYDAWGWVVGINRGAHGNTHAWNVRLTPGLVNLWN